VIDRLAANGIDLTRDAVEVSPHRALPHGWHPGGPADAHRRAAPAGGGEAVGGANGANRLSGNAITEALAFGRIAGEAARARRRGPGAAAAGGLRRGAGLLRAEGPATQHGGAGRRAAAGHGAGCRPFRTAAGLARARRGARGDRGATGEAPPGLPGWRMTWRGWTGWTAADAGGRALRGGGGAGRAPRSRGAHQREDHPEQAAWQVNQALRAGGSRAPRPPAVPA
jgi:succinate dehydrogenase/fumarate reductase flavoprotein subunit